MDEYLSEKEQIERIRNWWNDNGWYLVGGIVIGLAGLFGYNRYTDYVDSRSEQAAGIYIALEAAVNDDDLQGVDSNLARLRDEYSGTPYVDHAGLLVAKFVLVRDPERATDELRYVLDTTKDPQLALIARLRLARVLAYREDYDAALEVLDVDDPGQFAGRISEIRGDIYHDKGDVEAARAAYAEALVAPGSENIDRSFVQMKLSDLPLRGASNATEDEG